MRTRLPNALVTACGLMALGACTPEPDPPVDAGHAVAADAGTPELTDPLSMPSVPTHRMEDFASATQCAACHQEQHQQWRTSMHAYAMVDPVFQALVGVRQQHRAGQQDRFCVQCHSAAATRSGQVVPNFRFQDLSPVAMEGVTCVACHQVSSVQRAYNSGHALDPTGPLRGPLADPSTAAPHRSEYSALFQTAEFCAGCHDVVEANGVPLERPYAEWLESPAATEQRTCQTCHMPAYDGNAALDGPFRRGLRSHRFVGVDVPLKPGFATAQDEEGIVTDVENLLSQAAELVLEVPAAVPLGGQVDLHVTVRNRIDAHNLPTGTTFLRQLWLDVEVTDAAGTTVYRTGNLDGNGDLRDHYSALDPYGDDDLITLGSGLLDDRGRPELFPWRAVEHATASLPPLYRRTYTLFFTPAARSEGPLTVRARLRYRTHAPFLLRALGLDDLIPRVRIHDLATAQGTVNLEAP